MKITAFRSAGSTGRPPVGQALEGCHEARALARVQERLGVRIAVEPFDGPFGRAFAFLDPDGYAVTVHDGG